MFLYWKMFSLLNESVYAVFVFCSNTKCVTNFYVDLSDFANLNIVLSCMQIVYGCQFLLPGWSHYGSQLSIHIQCLAYLHWIFNFKIWLNCREQTKFITLPVIFVNSTWMWFILRMWLKWCWWFVIFWRFVTQIR